MASTRYGIAGASTRTHRGLAVGFPLVGILGSELLVYLGHVEYALWGYLGVLVGCLLAPVHLSEDLPIFQAFVLVPTFRLVNLGMPVFFELTLYWLPLVYGPLLPAAIYLVRRNPSITPAVKPAQTALLLPILVWLGILFAEAEYRILRPESLLSTPTVVWVVVFAVVMMLGVALVEELLFRVLLQGTLEAEIGRLQGLLVASVAFAATHSAYRLPAEIGVSFLLAITLGLLYTWLRSLAAVTVVHGVTNVFLFGIFPEYGSLVQWGQIISRLS